MSEPAPSMIPTITEYGCTLCQRYHVQGRDPLYQQHLAWQSKHGLRSRQECRHDPVDPRLLALCQDPGEVGKVTRPQQEPGHTTISARLGTRGFTWAVRPGEGWSLIAWTDGLWFKSVPDALIPEEVYDAIAGTP